MIDELNYIRLIHSFIKSKGTVIELGNIIDKTVKEYLRYTIVDEIYLQTYIEDNTMVIDFIMGHKRETSRMVFDSSLTESISCKLYTEERYGTVSIEPLSFPIRRIKTCLSKEGLEI